MPPTDSSPGRLHPAVAALCVTVLCLVWGSTWLVIRIGLQDLPPLTSAGVRFVVAASAMAFVVVPLFGRREGGDRPPLWLSANVGVLQFFVSYSVVYWSETILPSGLVAVLFATFPLMMAVAGHRFLGDRLRPRQVLGFVAGFAGVVTLFATDLEASGPAALFAGFVLLLSPLVTTIGTTTLKLHGQGYSSLRINRDAMAIGAALLCASAWFVEGGAPAAAWTPTAVTSVLYLALVGTCLTFGLYFWLMRRMSASKLSLIAFANPCVALVLGTLAGEPLTVWMLAGSALVVAGVALVLAPRRRVPAPSPSGERADAASGRSVRARGSAAG